MTEWIFQANPGSFDIDGFLATDPPTMLYLANQHRSAMAVGDTVFIWRAIGSGPEPLSGIVAEATIIDAPAVRIEEPAALPFWSDPSSAAPAHRVRLRIDRVELKDRLKRDWLKDDPICRDMRIFRMAAETNYRLPPDQGRRLLNVWRRAKAPWDYADTIAGLWAFAKTRNGKVSVLPGSPVAVAAIKTGRVVRKGMANKVSNFVSLDPRDTRTGFSNVNALDRAAWARFFDPATQNLDVAGIEEEFKRLWPDDNLPDVVAPPDPEARASDLDKVDLAELMKRWSRKQQQGGGGLKPKVVRATATSFQRDPLVVAIALKRAGWVCEVPGCGHALFSDANGKPFLEVHHIDPLRDGGVDTPENVAAICPSHHREAHHGENADAVTKALKMVRASAPLVVNPAAHAQPVAP
jgi:hypothetical protein